MNFHPPRPVPHSKPLNAVEFVLTMARNPLEVWAEGAYRRRSCSPGGWVFPIILISDPAAIRHVMGRQRQELCDAAAAPAAVAADPPRRAADRRGRAVEAHAPVDRPGVRAAQRAGAGPAMAERCTLFAEGLTDIGTTDIAEQMTLLTFRHSARRPLFTGDIAGEPREFAAATAELLRTMAASTRWTCSMPRPSCAPDAHPGPQGAGVLSDADRRDHRQAAKADGGKARAGAARSADAAARSRWPDADEVEDNIITFIGAGHEDHGAGPCLGLYLLSQAPEVRAKVRSRTRRT